MHFVCIHGPVKMESNPWKRMSSVLIGLLAAKAVYSAPTPTSSESATFSEKTQYPPSIQGARILSPQTEGVYHTELDRVGHILQKPTAIPSSAGRFQAVPHILGSVGEPYPLLGSLFPDQDSSEDSEPEPSASSDITTPSSTATHGVLEEPTAASEPSGGQESTSQVSTSATQVVQGTMAASQDAFVPGATGAVPQEITSRDDHPVPKKGVNSTSPIETNKFHSALFLGTQTNATFTHPYTLAWSKGSGNLTSFGMTVSHAEANVVANGPTNDKIPGNPISYYINPIGIQSIIFSATELTQSTVLTSENPSPFAADAVLRPQPGSSSKITIPVVQGMAYVSAVYTQLQPVIQSGIHFREVVTAASPRNGIFKYRATLEDGAVWLIYVNPGDGKDPGLKLASTTDLRGPTGWSGTIQVAKNPAGSSGESLFDNSSGVYATAAAVSGGVDGQTGTYRLSWTKAGKDAPSTPLMMYALPHHVAAFDSQTQGRAVNITLRTTTKGTAKAVIGESWTMVEPDLPTSMGFGPWVAATGNSPELSDASKSVIREAATTELKQDIDGQSNLNSMYYSGKALSKFATIIYTVDKLAGDSATAAPALDKLKQAFARFVQNKQQFPLIYDTVWKGVVSSASYGGDEGADFGNTLYNDHHFHYGYFIHAAAIIGALDPSWIDANRDWVNMLVRDSGNAATNDPLFPFSRGFDWYHGHSWAKGLFESFDGKDQESSSEDSMYAYALKMWGKTSGDASLEARGNLMLGVLRRSFHNYFLMDSDNVNQPANFIANKVTGILFENKIDHTTYFGANLEYIQGIHMLPLLPSSSYTRSQKFVREEWDAMFASNASTPAEKVEGGWKGVLYANLALIDPAASWNYFAQPNFDYGTIDGGASRTWYLAFAAGLGGGSAS